MVAADCLQAVSGTWLIVWVFFLAACKMVFFTGKDKLCKVSCYFLLSCYFFLNSADALGFFLNINWAQFIW